MLDSGPNECFARRDMAEGLIHENGPDWERDERQDVREIGFLA